MHQKILPEEGKNPKKHKFVRQCVAGLLAGVMALSATVALAPSVFAQEQEKQKEASSYTCGLEEHAHTEECYKKVTTAQERVLSCSVNTEGVTIVHTHDESCYNGVGTLVCALTERKTHAHTAECYGAPVLHAHSEGCYTPSDTPVCGTEGAEHTHTEECLKSLTCGKAEGEKEADGALICGKEELVLHGHTDEACYNITYHDDGTIDSKTLNCDAPVVEVHVHGDACFITTEAAAADVDTLTCGKENAEGHEHTGRCYGTWELVCELEEHAHTDACAAIVYQTYADRLAELKTQVEAFRKEDPESEGYEARENALWDALEQVEIHLGQSKASGEITVEEYDLLFAELDQVTNILAADVETEDSNAYADYVTPDDDNARFAPAYNLTTKVQLKDAGSAVVKINQTVDKAYRNIVLGNKAADSLNITLDSNAKGTCDCGYTGNGASPNNVGDNHGDGFRYVDHSKIASATAENYPKIAEKGGTKTPYSVRYYNIGTDSSGNVIDVKLTLVDYVIQKNNDYTGTNHNYQAPLIAFCSSGDGDKGSRPGVCVFHIEWIEVRYDFYYSGTDTPVANLKGSTSYYDVDNRQGVLLNTGNAGLYVQVGTGSNLPTGFPADPHDSHQCLLAYTTVVENTKYVYAGSGNASETDPCAAFTECFTAANGSMTRTFRFNASGGIFHYADQVTPLGTLKVKKVVSGTSIPNQEFTFKVTLYKDSGRTQVDTSYNGLYGEATFLNGVAMFDLKAGEEVTISYLDQGTYYKVEETSGNAEFDTKFSNDTGMITNGKTITATCTNTRKTGDVKVQKVVVSDPLEVNKAFSFTATVSEGTLKDSDKSFTLKNGETHIFDNLPVGAKLTITEKADSNYTTKISGGIVSGASTTYTITEKQHTPTSPADITFTNTRNLANISVKKVVGNHVDGNNAEFHFTATLTDGGKNINLGSNASFTLKHNQTKIFDDLPVGAVLTITETSGAGFKLADGQTGTQTATIAAGNNAEIVFNNTLLGNLEVTKTVIPATGKTVDANKEFTMNVTYGSTTVNPALTLKNGGTQTYTDIPVGTSFTVSEDADSAYGYAVTYKVDNVETDTDTVTGTIPHGTTTVAVTNTELTAETSIKITKTLTSADTDDKVYKFNVVQVDEDQNPIDPDADPVVVSVEVKEGEISGESYFNPTYYGSELEEDGVNVYYYKISEDRTGFDDEKIDADESSYVITVTVNGTLANTLTATADKDEVSFNNTLLTELKVTKAMDGDAAENKTFAMEAVIESPYFEEGEQYTLTGITDPITAEDGKITVAFDLAPEKSITIGKLPVGAEYTVTEKTDSAYGYAISYEGETGTLTTSEAQVTVTNKELTTPVIDKDGKAGIAVTKFIANSDNQKHTFDFALVETDSTGKVLSGGISLKQSITFKDAKEEFRFPIEYKTTMLDGGAEKKFYYQITETTESDTYTLIADESVYIVEVTLTGGEGTLEATVTGITKDGKKTDNISFTNVLLGSLTLNKQIIGKHPAGKTFTFTITGLDDGNYAAALNGKDYSVNVEDGTYSIKLTHKDSLVIYGIPHGTKVTITEAKSEYTARYVVNSGWQHKGTVVTTEVATSGTEVLFKNYSPYGLPQTGQLKWIIPVLAVLGAGLIGLGFFTQKRKKNYGK